MSEKIYLGRLAEKDVPWGKILTGRVYVNRILKEFIKEDKKGNKYINIDIVDLKTQDEYGNIKNIILNTYKPKDDIF